MLNLTNLPPDDSTSQPLPVTRAPAAKPFIAIITSHGFYGCFTHFWGGRTVPCQTPTCDACLNGVPKRWHGYLSAWSDDTQQHVLFEFTSNAAEAFFTYWRSHRTLRGGQFKATRTPPTKNGRLTIAIRPWTGQYETLPETADIVRCLSRLWNIPQNDIIIPQARTIIENLSSLQPTDPASVHQHAPNNRIEPQPQTNIPNENGRPAKQPL